MAEFKKLFESKVAKITEDDGLSVELQAGTVPRVAIWLRYVNEDGEWGYCNPKGAKAVRIPTMTPKVIDWLIEQLETAKAALEEAQAATVKKSKTKAPAKRKDTVDLSTVSTKKAAAALDIDDDEELVLESTRTRSRKRARR